MTSTIRIYSYSACTTCKKALKWLDENQIDYQLIDIAQCPPDKDILSVAIKQLGNRKKVFNTSGLSYRNLGSKVVQSMSDDEAIQALASDGKLIKRPFVINDDKRIIVGFNEANWIDFFQR